MIYLHLVEKKVFYGCFLYLFCYFQGHMCNSCSPDIFLGVSKLLDVGNLFIEEEQGLRFF